MIVMPASLLPGKPLNCASGKAERAAMRADQIAYGRAIAWRAEHPIDAPVLKDTDNLVGYGFGHPAWLRDRPGGHRRGPFLLRQKRSGRRAVSGGLRGAGRFGV
jgi:hypothetical protein